MSGVSGERAFVGLGGNVGDVRDAFVRAAEALAEVTGVVAGSVRRSSSYETAPVGDVVDQPPFLNGCVELRFEGHPRELLEALLAIEAELGRDRAREPRGGPRKIDLDLLVFGDRQVSEDGLVVPHPRLARRAFALAPLVELAGPDLEIPGVGRSGEALERVLRDGAQSVRRID